MYYYLNIVTKMAALHEIDLVIIQGHQAHLQT